jgi:type II secretory pathway component PulF
MSATTPVRTRYPIQYVALLFGVVFLLVGIMGFIPGITANYGSMSIAGHHSEAMLLGIFQVSILHNAVHLLYGIVGVMVWGSTRSSRHYLRWGGLIYAVLWIYGLIIDLDSQANFVPLNTADNWLHLVLAVAMVALSFLPTKNDPQAGVV